jgi:hypothetical protein
MRTDLIGLGRVLLGIGATLVILGLVLVVAGKRSGGPPSEPAEGWGLGRLPGDIHIDRGNYTFHFPIVTCILLSILLTIIFAVIARFLRR